MLMGYLRDHVNVSFLEPEDPNERYEEYPLFDSYFCLRALPSLCLASNLLIFFGTSSILSNVRIESQVGDEQKQGRLLHSPSRFCLSKINNDDM